MTVDLNARFDRTLSFYGGSNRKSSVTHLAGLVSVGVPRFLGLPFDRHAVFERLQNATGSTHNLHVLLNAACDLYISFAGDACSHFDEANFVVVLDNIDALLRLRFLTAG